jgi:hypothetical protein
MPVIISATEEVLDGMEPEALRTVQDINLDTYDLGREPGMTGHDDKF